MRMRSVVLLTTILCGSAWGQTYTISTFAGGGLPVNMPGTSASLGHSAPGSIAADRAGNVFFVDRNSVLRLDAATGLVTLVAGNGDQAFSGDNGPATSASLNTPRGVAVDSASNLYIADSGNYRIRKVSGGVITTVAGNGASGFSGDNVPAGSAALFSPLGIAVDSNGSLYFVDSGGLPGNSRIRKVSGGVLTTVAGGGESGLGDGGPATSAQFNFPIAVAVDSAGNVYISDTTINLVRKVSNGVITTVAGNGTPGSSGDNGPAASAQLHNPQGIAVDSAGNLYIADSYNNRIRKVSGGVITTVAGNGTPGFSGDNAPAIAAQLQGPTGLAMDAAGGLYIADSGNYRIRKVSNGAIATVAGTGWSSFGGDGGLATGAQLFWPQGVAVDSTGNVYIADTQNFSVRKVAKGVVTTVAGTGTQLQGPIGPATNAQLTYPTGVAADSVGNLYIADRDSNSIRKVANGVITTAVGGGSAWVGPPTIDWLYGPSGVAVDGAGGLYIADTYNQLVRKVSNGVVTDVAGTGMHEPSSGDNSPATSASLFSPTAVAVDSAGNLYIADSGNSRIRKVSNGIITTVAGNGGYGFSGDNGPATSAQLYDPYGVAVDSAGNLYIADTGNSRIRKVSNGVIATIAGNGTYGFTGDNGPATSAQLTRSYGVAVDSAGNVYIADTDNSRIRVLTPATASAQGPTITSMVNAASYEIGPISPGELVTVFGAGIGPATAARATTDPATGRLATSIGDVRVLFNGTPAPVIYASGTQVSAVVPYEMASIANPSVWIEYAGQTSNAYPLSLAAAAPGLFAQNASGSGPGAILNQDNSLNGPGHAAAKGSVVQVYMTGEGQTSPPGVTGKITTATLPPPQVTPAPVQSIQVSIGGQQVPYTYAGEAPGMVAGVMQLNVRIPANAASGTLAIAVSAGGNTSQNGITVTVQ